MRLIVCTVVFTAHVLAAPGSPAWQILTEGAAESSGYKRSEAISALGTIRSAEADKFVAAALADKDIMVRLAAVSALAERKSRADSPTLRKALNDESGEVSFIAARALWEMGDRSGRDVLEEVMFGEQKKPGFIKKQIRGAKATAHDRKGLVWLGAREGAGFLFGPLGAGLGLMEQAMKDDAAQARVLSATLLAQERGPEAIGLLGEALVDKNPLVRAVAAKLLGGFSGPSVRGKLEPLLEDKNDTVRYMAAASIVRIGRKSRR
jgi:HEAT repeat protein